jgi:small subunit ribosomal protein S8
MNTDPIADYLTRIRNAEKAGHKTAIIPYSKIKEGISKVLAEKNFIENYKIEESGKFKELIVTLKLNNNGFQHYKRISKPGQRIYIKSKDIKKVRSGLGILVISTSKGIMTGDEAKKQKLGGEVLCEVY